jgi:hypothetical protein
MAQSTSQASIPKPVANRPTDPETNTDRSSATSTQFEERARQDNEVIRKLQVQVRELQETNAGFVRDMGVKLAQAEDEKIRSEREVATMKEQVRALQVDFRGKFWVFVLQRGCRAHSRFQAVPQHTSRNPYHISKTDFSVQTVYKQRQEMENFVKNQMAKLQVDESDWKSDLRKQVQSLSEDFSRVHNAQDEHDQHFSNFKGDARARLNALENALLGGGAEASGVQTAGIEEQCFVVLTVWRGAREAPCSDQAIISPHDGTPQAMARPQPAVLRASTSVNSLTSCGST